MRAPGGVLALLVAAFVFCTTCGCLGASTSPTGGGITPVDLPEPPGSSTFAEALAELDLLGAEGNLNVTGTTVHQVLGTGVDLDGRATSWALGLRDGDGGVRWLTFGRTGWKEISLRAPVPAEEVVLADALSPADLFGGQGETISAAMTRLGADTVDLALAEGAYVVTVRTDAGMETFVFRADTGEAIV
ncbi:hypothetical protein F8E02_02720 [Methanoculleus sp. Wushi-C6]|uniref:Uncharacterized protein n=1 Tax=Methanoculleus caldifontis TaxID=2651577 RepID=A0ABU3WYQ6_9EURY|nr:hypothetical protein [Methanoculleus sp. Wushi-C6]MDV2480938.1 hypothetical protein [Methanoculleus sp. Wushi-C6]